MNNIKVFEAYKRLLKKYGKQYWWPADTNYEVIIGAILTQNTSWKNVEKAINNLKSRHVLNPNSIINLDLNELKQLIRPAGFYNQKSVRLKNATKAFLHIRKQADRLSTSELRKYFLSIKGIGKETADSIILYAFNKPIFVVDAYTRRFCKKQFNITFKEYDDYRSFFESNLPKDVKIYKEYHALIVEWGKRNKSAKIK